MSAKTTNGNEGGATAPPGYRRVENHSSPGQWIHEATGLCVDVHRFARYRSVRDVMPDHYEYQLVIRPDGPGTPGECVDSTMRGFENATGRTPEEMARDWMREHPDGAVDLDEEGV